MTLSYPEVTTEKTNLNTNKNMLCILDIVFVGFKHQQVSHIR